MELKHIIGYLPYGLKCKNTFGNIVELKGISNPSLNQFNWHFRDHNQDLIGYSYECKPILRPLSDLTKEIEVDGEKFVPIKRLLEIALKSFKIDNSIEFSLKNNPLCYSIVLKTNGKNSLGFHFDTSDNSFMMISNNKTVCVPNQLELFEFLYKHHFDIHSLIDQNKAIDINQINK